jgi:hypothetical protein
LRRQVRPRCREAPLRRRDSRAEELRILIQDLSLELVECRAGLYPELADEPRAGFLEHSKRVGLSSNAVEREHQLRVHSLAMRVIDDEALELWDDLCLPSKLEVGSDLLLDDCQSELLEPHSLGDGKLLIPKVR